MVKMKICQFPQLGAVVIGAELGAKIYGAELGAKIHSAELMPRPRHASSNVNDMQKMTLDLGANCFDVETCNLGANCHGAEARVYFLKEYYQGRIYENLSKKKGAEN